MTFVRRSLLLVGLTILGCGALLAQVTTGTPPFGSVDGSSGPDVIDLANLNAHIPIPVLHKAGRGTDFTYDLSYDSSIWYPAASTWQPVLNWGWRGQTEITTGYISYTTQYQQNSPWCHSIYYLNFVYHDAWGVPHPLPGEAFAGDLGGNYRCGTPFFQGLSSTASDGSGYSIVIPSSNTRGNFPGGTLYDRDGKVYSVPFNWFGGSGNFTDRNGNQITVNSSGQFFDTLSSTSPVVTVSGSGTSTSPMLFTYTAPSGATPSYTINYTNYTVATNFGLSGTSEYKSSAAVPLPTSIVLPDGSQYSIQYEATPSTPAAGACTPYAGTTCVTARIKSITLPTGGSINYTYTGGHNGVLADGSTAGLTRVLSDGASWSATWNYSRSQGSGAASTNAITDPLGDVTTMQFQGIYETQRVVNDVSLGLLQTVNTCYNGAASPCTGTAVTLPISSRTVTTILPGSANLQAKVATSYNSYGQLTEEDDYDYGQGAPPSTPIRKKIITIQTVGTYQAIQTAQIQDSSAHILAQTQMTFDQGSVVATSGTPQHQNPTVGRGNPTTISYLVGGSTSLTKTLTYFDTGNVASFTDVNGAQATFTYGACGNSFPTSISEPLSLTQSIVWNCTGGVSTSVTDENGNPLSTSYSDAYFWRPAYTKDQLLNQTNLTYIGQTAVETSMNFNSNNSTSDTLTTFDGLGRVHISQAKQSPTSTSYDSVETDYDAVGRPARVTRPYSGTASQTNSSAPVVTTAYDALGRPLSVSDARGGTVSYTYSQNDVYQTLGPAPASENTKRRQLEFDSLGRLTSVCEVTGGTAPAPAGTCSQTSSATGYWTKYAYDANGNLIGVTQNAQAASGQQQTRSYSYDDLRRMTSETNPETGGATGTTAVNYTYDSDPTCGSYSGDLVKKTDAVGDTICHTYDALHRLTSTTYAGTYASVTPSKHFVYDTATVNGVAMTSAKTRLAEAYTCYSPCSSKLTDVGFSYTARGEASDEYESTLHLNGYYYRLSVTYWPNGGVNQLNPASCSGQPCFSGLPTFTYGADGEGRPTTVSASSGQNPVTGTIYNPYGTPPQATVNFGSGDSDVFNFDPNTGRATQYKFNVGSQPQSVTGALTWNANGSLGGLTITDPFNSSNGQTCSYSHDDLARILNTSCTSTPPWSQAFTYFDAFGNLTKSGNSSFSASFSPSTNRMTMIGSSAPSYDANGNVTNDFLHTYAWDADGRPVTIDGVAATYDALGRMVELNRSGSYTEIAYDPSGDERAIMNGQTLQRAFIPLPAGATAVYSSSGLDHYRHPDWLGSARLATTPSQTVYGDVAYAPYGETYAATGNTDFSWTGMNANVEPANPETLYDFLAREYGVQGRWPSPDPLGIDSADPGNPQSWNRYAYVNNNPLAATDPTGTFTCGSYLLICPTTPDPTTDIIITIIDVVADLLSLFGFHHHHVTPHAPTAPSGGYGAGIDPFGNSFLGGLIDIGCTKSKVGNRGSWGPWNCHVYIDGVDVGTVGDVFPSLAGPVAIALALPNGSVQLPDYPTPSRPSCAGTYAEGFENAFDKTSLIPNSPTLSPPGGSPEELLATGARARANQYIVDRGLVVPLRSGIFRGMNFVADVTELYPLIQMGVGETGGAIALGKAKFVDHSCQMP